MPNYPPKLSKMGWLLLMVAASGSTRQHIGRLSPWRTVRGAPLFRGRGHSAAAAAAAPSSRSAEAEPYVFPAGPPHPALHEQTIWAFDTRRFPFREAVMDVLRVDRSLDLSRAHVWSGAPHDKSGNVVNALQLRWNADRDRAGHHGDDDGAADGDDDDGAVRQAAYERFDTVYEHFMRELVAPALGGGRVLFQRAPTLRVMAPAPGGGGGGAKSVMSVLHNDMNYHHQPSEVASSRCLFAPLFSIVPILDHVRAIATCVVGAGSEAQAKRRRKQTRCRVRGCGSTSVALHCIALHCIASHRITSHHITPTSTSTSTSISLHHITSRHITSHHITSHHITRSQVNLWLPLTTVGGSNSLWVESAPGRADFAPLEMEYGECCAFYGNQCRCAGAGDSGQARCAAGDAEPTTTAPDRCYRALSLLWSGCLGRERSLPPRRSGSASFTCRSVATVIIYKQDQRSFDSCYHALSMLWSGCLGRERSLPPRRSGSASFSSP